MVAISNPACISYLRNTSKTNMEVVERAVCARLGITPRLYTTKTRGRPKHTECCNRLPVKIRDERVVQFILLQKRTCGACYRHTVESAMLASMPRKRKGVR